MANDELREKLAELCKWDQAATRERERKRLLRLQQEKEEEKGKK